MVAKCRLKYLGRPLVYFAGYEKHIGFTLPQPGMMSLKTNWQKYKQERFRTIPRLLKKLPLKLIENQLFRVKENELKAAAKK